MGDVIVDGVPTPPGDTVWEQSRFVAEDGALRSFVLNEPRGGMFRHVNLLVPPVDPAAAVGFIIMEPEHNPPMSGSNSMCVATVVLETGIVPMTEPITEMVMEAPGGLVPVTARCEDGKVLDVTVTNLPSFVGKQDVMLDVPGLGSLRVDTAFGGDSFVLVNAADLDVRVLPEQARELAQLGQRITAAATEQVGFEHPTLPWTHVSFCQIAEAAEQVSPTGWKMRSTTVVDPGKLDRSPTGTGVSARMALMQAQGRMAVGDTLRMRSVIDSEFVGRIAAETSVQGVAAISPQITGRAWRTGETVHRLDPTDPWPGGYRLTDTWPLMPRG